MYDFLVLQFSAETLFHYETMLKDVNTAVVFVEGSVWMLNHTISLRHFYATPPRIVFRASCPFASQFDADFA